MPESLTGTLLSMRRALLICLMLLLPFQFSWSAAAATCVHEYLEGSSLWGHHEAEHVSEASAKPSTDKSSLDTEGRSGATHVDHHHLPNLSPLPALYVSPFLVDKSSTALFDLSVDFSTATTSGLDRPPKSRAETLRRDGPGYA